MLALAHEGLIDLLDRQALFFTSNRLRLADGSHYLVVSLFDFSSGVITDLVLSSLIPMANGALRLKNGSIVVAMQGHLKQPAGLASFDLNTRKVTLHTEGFAGYQFNS